MCLSFRTPPAVRPQAILIGKMIPEWIKQGVKPVIITYESEEKWDIDLPIYYVPQLSINRYFNKISFLRGWLEKKYYKKIYKIVEPLVKKHNIDLLFSFSNPYASNILGAMLKEKLGVKFISHFSDPWLEDPYENFPKSELKRIKNLENLIVSNSDRIVFTNEIAKNLVMDKYSLSAKDKARVIPHCFDLKDYQNNEEQKDSNFFVISHIGSFYVRRDPKILFQAVNKLFEKDSEFKNKVKIKLVGGISNYTDYKIHNLKDDIENYKLQNNIEVISSVSYQESLKYMQQSDCLLVIDANFSPSPFFPSKVVDYAGSGTLILGITPDQSPTNKFLKNLGYQTFNYEQADEIAKYLEGLIIGSIKPKINQEYLEKFNVKSTTASLINIFNQV